MSALHTVPLAPVASVNDLKEQFLDEEVGFEIAAFGVARKADGSMTNFIRIREYLVPEALPALTIETPAAGPVDETFLKNLLARNLRIIPGTFSGIIAGQQRDFVVCRPNAGLAPLVIKGKMSFFGGPADEGVGPDEGLALVERTEMNRYPADMFLSEAEAHAPGLARRLNPAKAYLACRWSELGLPTTKFRSHLQHALIEVENASNGQKRNDVRAVDAGPGILTRVTDLSPLFKTLGLETDQEVIVRIPRPVQSAKAEMAARQQSIILGDLSITVAIPPRDTFNNGLSAANESTMLQKFGVPGHKTADCSTPSAAFQAQLVRNFDVGPFRVTGLRIAAESLKRVFDAASARIPDVVKQARTDGLGMLCVRHRRTNANSFSNHSFGTAIDLKFGPDEVDQGTRLTQKGVLSLVPFFNEGGWFWGAGFSGNAVDSMHFEFAEETIRNLPNA